MKHHIRSKVALKHFLGRFPPNSQIIHHTQCRHTQFLETYFSQLIAQSTDFSQETSKKQLTMAQNYFKSSYSYKIVRSSSHGFVTRSQKKSTTFTVRMIKSSRQLVRDETFCRLHALCRSFKTQFRHTFTRINYIFFPIISHSKCFFQENKI